MLRDINKVLFFAYLLLNVIITQKNILVKYKNKIFKNIVLNRILFIQQILHKFKNLIFLLKNDHLKKMKTKCI